jgi:hypothetical protein
MQSIAESGLVPDGWRRRVTSHVWEGLDRADADLARVNGPKHARHCGQIVRWCCDARLLPRDDSALARSARQQLRGFPLDCVSRWGW